MPRTYARNRFTLAIAIFLVAVAVQHCLAAPPKETPGTKAMKQRLAITGLDVTNACSANPEGDAVTSFEIRWNAYQSSKPMIQPELEKAPTGGGFTISNSKVKPGTLSLPRSSELSSDQIVVVEVDSQQRMCGWNVVADPRTVRAEHGDVEGNIKGNLFHRTTAFLLVELPQSPSARQLRFYHPRWTGTTFVLDPLGAAQLTPAQEVQR